MTLIREICDMAQEELSDRYPKTKTEITMVQSYYMPSTNSTHFLIVAFVNNRSHTGSGNSASMAVNALIRNVENGK
jgi:hypothetical protein